MTNATPSPYELKISLNVLEHLGIYLYSTLPAVLSEVVANAWDADATQVTIDWDSDVGKITISDNGQGMSQEELNKRFLFIGYQRRIHQPGITLKGRSPMGRKGIGKLSLFSIAETIDVASSNGGAWNAFQMQREDILEAINNDSASSDGSEIAVYHPPRIEISNPPKGTGTVITLSNLRRRPSAATTKFLRQRIARRFSIISDSHEFAVTVNGEPVTTADRGYQQHIQYLWEYGSTPISNEGFIALDRGKEARPFTVKPEPMALNAEMKVQGWIGTVRSSGMLKGDDEENLNRIAIFVRGKMAQQDILGDFAERGVYAGYVVGELNVSGLDVFDGGETELDDDIATTSRQHLVDDDPRYIALRKFIKTELQYIGNRWNEWRLDEGAEFALEIPEVKEWHKALPPAEAQMARKWLGKLNRIPLGEVSERKQRIKHTVLAFEAFRNQQLLEELDTLPEQSLPEVLRIAGRLDQVEMSYYTAIVKQRLAVIHTMREYAESNAVEKAVQQYLFEHLWLLDPSWERADSATTMEEKVTAIIKNADGEDEKILNGRLDIRYRKTAGTHVVIELKRPDRRISVLTTIAEQIQKYRLGIIQELEQQNRSNELVEIILLVGKEPEEWANQSAKEPAIASLKAQNARVVFYNQLLEDAYHQYKDYLEAHATIDHLSKLIAAIENFADPDSAEGPQTG